MPLRRIDDMPAGTIGFEAIGEVEDDDWEKEVEPVFRSEMAEGQKIRLLYLVGSEAQEVEGDAMKADTGFRAAMSRRSSASRWSATRTGSDPRCGPLVLLPGKDKGFQVGELEDAKTWLAEGGT